MDYWQRRGYQAQSWYCRPQGSGKQRQRLVGDLNVDMLERNDIADIFRDAIGQL